MFCLIEDDDAHWYVCPTDKISEAGDFFRNTYIYWKEIHDYYEHEYNPPAQPTWLISVGGSPSLVRFKEFIID